VTLLLAPDDLSMLHGERGEATAFAMQILVAFSRAVGAASLLDITRAHIDGCLYHGQVSLDTGSTLRLRWLCSRTRKREPAETGRTSQEGAQ